MKKKSKAQYRIKKRLEMAIYNYEKGITTREEFEAQLRLCRSIGVEAFNKHMARMIKLKEGKENETNANRSSESLRDSRKLSSRTG